MWFQMVLWDVSFAGCITIYMWEERWMSEEGKLADITIICTRCWIASHHHQRSFCTIPKNKNISFFVDLYKSEENVRGGQTWFTAERRPNILCKFYIKSKFNGLQNYKLLSPRNYLKFIMVNKKVLLDDSLLLASRNWKVWNIDILLVISTWQIKLNISQQRIVFFGEVMVSTKWFQKSIL